MLSHVFLDNSASTSATAGKVLEPGLWKFSLDTTNTDASITIETKAKGGTNWVPVTKNGVTVLLTTLEPSIMEHSVGEQYRVTNADGTPAVTVRADLAHT